MLQKGHGEKEPFCIMGRITEKDSLSGGQLHLSVNVHNVHPVTQQFALIIYPVCVHRSVFKNTH